MMSLTMVGVSVLGTVFYGLRHRDISRDYMERSVSPTKTPEVVGNIPLRSFTQGTSYDNFNQTSEPDKESRENAIVQFLNTVQHLDTANSLAARFAVDSNLANPASAQAAKTRSTKPATKDMKPVKKNVDVWWIKQYRLQTLFPDSEQRWLPVSFVLAATDRANATQYMFHGAVKSMVVQSDVDIFSNVNVEEAALKLTFTLVDTNWRNLGKDGAPKEFKYVCTQENNRSVTSAILDAQGSALPVFVSSFGFRLERDPVDYSTDVWHRFRMQGLGFDVNSRTNKDELNPEHTALASVRFHDNSGAKITFLFRAVPMLFKAGVTTNWNTKSGSIFIHTLSPASVKSDGLPMVINVGLNSYTVGMARIGTAMEMREPGDLEWDANTVKTIAFETVDGEHEFVLDPSTGEWSDRHPVTTIVTPINDNTSIDLVVLSDLPARSFSLTDVPVHGVEEFSNFRSRGFNRHLNFGLREYLQVHAFAPTLSTFDMENEINEGWWHWSGTGEESGWLWGLCLVVLVALFAGWTMTSRRVMSMGPRLGALVGVMGIVYLVLAIMLSHTGLESPFVVYGDKLLYIGGGILVFVTSIYFMLCSRIIGAPPLTFIVAMLVMAQAAGMAYMIRFNGRPEVLTSEIRVLVSAQAHAAALACFVIAIEMHNNKYFPGGVCPAVSFRPGFGSVFTGTFAVFVVLVYVLFSYTRSGWDESCSRANFKRERALEQINTTQDEKALAFYRKEYYSTDACSVEKERWVGVGVFGVVVLVWVLGPVLSHLMSRMFVKSVGYEERDSVDLLKPAPHPRVFWAKLLVAYASLAVVLSKVVPMSGVLERGELYTTVCEDARGSMEVYNKDYNRSMQFDSVQKKHELLDGMTSLECVPTTNIVAMVFAATIASLWLMAVVTKRRSVSSSNSVWGSAAFAVLVCLIVYSAAWMWDDARRLELLSVNFPEYLNQFMDGLYPRL